tara:strand:+ start:142 stop:342 length:201 start_codon:yes stop_codon:yes gene_type:complete
MSSGPPTTLWDVTTDKNRWWVITNSTNFHSQKHFPSLGYTPSFHLGENDRGRALEAVEMVGYGSAA